jgi:antitoxin PrlF
MAIARSKLTAQGQISVPAEVRRKLGVGPGSILEWEQEGDKFVVHRVGGYSFEDIHRKLFAGRAPKKRTLKELKAGIGEYIRERYARD